jgi:hypothetical protein
MKLQSVHAIGYLQPLLNDSEDSINCPLLMPLTAFKTAGPITSHRTIELAAGRESARCSISCLQCLAPPQPRRLPRFLNAYQKPPGDSGIALWPWRLPQPSRARHFRLYESENHLSGQIGLNPLPRSSQLPVHSTLIKLGLLKYAQRIEGEWLFPALYRVVPMASAAGTCRRPSRRTARGFR